MTNLDDKLKATVLAAALQEETTKKAGRSLLTLAWSAVALALASLAIVIALPSGPKDTFEDPSLAYAEVEKTFLMISQKIDKGFDVARRVEEPMETIYNLFK